MKRVLVRKTGLHESNESDDLKGKSPQELIGMMWQLTLSAWSFKEKIDVEPRLQRNVVVLKRRKG
ncbi:MAG: hypothetical protein J2P41_14860 [Blastocatellia bacterium]|nr:hypothetical protein [Blastocatellia bacterium]